MAHLDELGLIYFVQLLFGLIVAVILCGIINEHLGQSAALEQLAMGFDRTVIMDMVYNNKGAFDPIKKSITILLPIYLVLSIILQGGLLSNIKEGSTDILSQIKSGTKYFFPFLGIALISLLSIVLFAAVIGIPFSKAVGDPLVTFSSEKPFVWWLIGLGVLSSFLLICIWSWSVGSRYAYIEEDNFLKALGRGFGFLRRNFFKIISVGYLLFGICLLLGLIYYLIMGDRGAPSYLVVIFGIVVQQIFAFLRVMVRGFGYVVLEQMEEDL